MRASGESAAVEEAKAETEQMDQPIETEVLPEERGRSFRTPGFSRMRTDWRSEDRTVIRHAQDTVEGRILANFEDAYQVMHEVYDLVRTPEVDLGSGEIRTDRWGFPIWKKTVSGSYEEDWTALTSKQRQNLLFTLTTRLFEWSQRAADAWGEAMFAKAQFEERFAIGFDEPMSGTVDDRRAHANIESREERYFAIFLSYYSRRADSIVRVMSLLGQRLKDSME
jgi:hypothetical protein